MSSNGNKQESVNVNAPQQENVAKVLDSLKGVMPAALSLNMSEAGTLEVIFKYADKDLARQAAESVIQQTRERKAREAPRAARGTPTTNYKGSIPMVASTERVIGNNELFMGMQESALGEFFAFEPGSEINADRINDALRLGGFAPFDAKSVKKQLGEAARSLPIALYHAQALNKGRAVGQRWQISRKRPEANVGEAGTVVQITVELDQNDNIVYSGDAKLEQEIRKEFERLLNVVKGPDVTMRVEYLFRKLGAVRTLFGWFVRNERLPIARALKECLQGVWGKWGAIPVSSVDSFRLTIKEGLSREISALASKVNEELAEGMTPKIAVNRLQEIDGLDQRVLSYRPIIGDGHTLGLRTDVAQMRRPVEERATDADQRAALVWEELPEAFR